MSFNLILSNPPYGKSAAYVSKDEAEDLVKIFKDLVIELAKELKEKTN